MADTVEMELASAIVTATVATADDASAHSSAATAPTAAAGAGTRAGAVTSPRPADSSSSLGDGLLGLPAPGAAAVAEPVFPLLQNNADAGPDTLGTGATVTSRAGGAGRAAAADDNYEEEEPAVARPFHRSDSAAHTGELVDDDPPFFDAVGVGARRTRPVHNMHRFTLYETASRFYLVGCDMAETRYRVLKIDRTLDVVAELSITDDPTVYSQKDMNQLLDTIDDGNKGTGGMKLRCTTWGLLGFIKFTGPWYMLLITKKSTVAMIGGHYVYQIDGTELVQITSPPGSKTDKRNTEESRFLGILNNLDLTRSFYYSYSYDITRTLQHNIIRERNALIKGEPCDVDADVNSMFVWNNYLLAPAAKVLDTPYDWCRPIIHGHVDQAALSIYGRTAHITLIARRSRHFAGARFLKRGANDLGYVANDVETEQIVSEALTTSFHAPGPRFYASPAYTSYVQHRGSIPLYWTQDSTGVTPKPPIELTLFDPFYSAAALHFDNLFERYGSPIYALNLVKSHERTPREGKLLAAYTDAIRYLNQSLPEKHKIIHHAWDMGRAAKNRQDVIGTLENIAEDVVSTTGFFHNGDGHITPVRVQNGVARTNCIDCLDRTNAAQFVIGKRALGHQLHALGILEDIDLEYDTDAVNMLTHMYHDHGDSIAMQYGGSQLVNTMETYRRINQWTSQSRDMIESFKRYYNNSFLDAQRQEAYNLFLGNYIFVQGQPMLWDLSTDYYLHHENPRTFFEKRKPHYINWFTPEFLKERVLPSYPPTPPERAPEKAVTAYDDYWVEYYRPSVLSSLVKMFPYKMNSTIKYIPFKSTQDGRYDLSPFRVRSDPDQDVPEKRRVRKEVTILTPEDMADADTKSLNGSQARSPSSVPTHGIQRWLHRHPHDKTTNGLQGIMKDTSANSTEEALANGVSKGIQKPSALEKSRAAQWTFQQVVTESLNPTVSTAETEDYAHYISHPQNLPLVVSAETPAAGEIEPEYQEYINGSWQLEGLTAAKPVHEDDMALYMEMLNIGEDPLTVTEPDALKKRYKAYRKWLRGKSLFKQQPVD